MGISELYVVLTIVCNLFELELELPEESSKETVQASVKGVLDQLNEKPVLDKCDRVGSPTAGKVRPFSRVRDELALSVRVWLGFGLRLSVRAISLSVTV
eukprot:sb/3478630/